MHRQTGFAAGVRREARSLLEARRVGGWQFAIATRLQHHSGVSALRESVARELSELRRRLDVHESALADQAAATGDLRWRPLDAIAPTMAWVEQATVPETTLVSIVMATRDRCELLPRAISSALAQTYTNFELLVVDDGSVDATPDVLASIDDRRVRALRIPAGGVCVARNAGLEAARGDLVAYLDDDNAMHRGWLKAVAWAFAQHPEAETLYGAIVIDDFARTRRGPAGDLPGIWLHPYDRAKLAVHNLADMGAIAHRAGLAEAHFDETLGRFSDWDLLARLTTDRDPLVLPALACFYSTDAPHRISVRPDEYVEAELVRRRVRTARGLEPPPDQWTLGPTALELVLERIPGSEAAVVECGSGESTIAIARLLRSRGGGRIYALEHHRGWAAELLGRIEAEGLGSWARVIEAPLAPHPLAEQGCEWYSADALDRLPPRIDLLLVDGPPVWDGGSRVRYPALPALADRLAPGAAVILDDAARAGERWTLERWHEELGVEFELDREAGVAIGKWPGVGCEASPNKQTREAEEV